MIGRRPGGSPKARKRRRFKFSLNGLAIQLSAFALSFTLVALLVVSGSQAAFVEQNESVANFVPPEAAEPVGGDGGRSPRRSPTAAPAPSPTVVPVGATPAEEPTEETPADPGTPTTSVSAAPSEDPLPEEPVLPPVPDPEIELTDSDAGTAMFGNLTLAPGVTVDRCIEVTYAGNVDPGPVVMYAASTTGDLAPYLDLTIQIGTDTAGAFGSCGGFAPSATLFTGTLGGFGTDHGGSGDGLPTWDPGDEQESRSFRFSVSVRDVPAAAGKSASFGFSWRAEAP